jgi:hypothetical protein
MRMLRTFRLDATDEHAFERAAAPGEWAVPGGFAFADAAPARLTGKRRLAFRTGFLGLDSFGWSTFAIVVDIAEAELEALEGRLARHLVEAFGAPDIETARPVARAELEFARGLCEHPVNTILLVEREATAEGVRERFRTVRRPAAPRHAPIWAIEPDPEDAR